MNHTRLALLSTLATCTLSLAAGPADAAWPAWRGPDQNGTAAAVGLVHGWTPGGAGQAWKADFTGRSTPVVVDGRVFVIGRVGKDVTEQERVAAFDAATGRLLWEDRFNVFHTTIPFNRVGWASLAADPESGYVYAHGVQGLLRCYTADGQLLWSRSLTEEFGRISGYGGRVQTPVVAGDLLVVNFLSSSWGSHAGPPKDRYFAFDKASGEVVWIAAPGGRPLDTTYGTPVVADIDGQRLLIAGNADGAVYAMRLADGEKVWGFNLSKRGLNATVVVDGHRVYASHGEENLDTVTMGRVVCIDGRGTGDVTATHELWRHDGLMAGYASSALAGGVLYVIDNSANLLALDAGTGQERWHLNLGTVGRGSPVIADGRLYATTVNGLFHIVGLADDGGTLLDSDRILAPDGGPAEIFGSPAVAYGRVYFTTDEGLYCLGAAGQALDPAVPALDPAVVDREFPSPTDAPEATAPQPRRVPALLLVPAETVVAPGATIEFDVRRVDAVTGRSLGGAMWSDLAWAVDGLQGTVDRGKLRFAADAAAPDHAGTVTVTRGDLSATARVRVLTRDSWSLDFDAGGPVTAQAPAPGHWIGSAGKFAVRHADGTNVLHKDLADRGLQRSNVYVGPADLSGYTIQVDVKGTVHRRNRPDMGLIAQRYIFDLMGNHQQLQVRSWPSDLRMAKSVPFAWDTDVWYTMKMRVDVDDAGAVVRGKVWRRGEPEPAAWSIEAEDPLPNREGAPGIYGYSAGEIYYDNIRLEIDD